MLLKTSGQRETFSRIRSIPARAPSTGQAELLGLRQQVVDARRASECTDLEEPGPDAPWTSPARARGRKRGQAPASFDVQQRVASPAPRLQANSILVGPFVPVNRVRDGVIFFSYTMPRCQERASSPGAAEGAVRADRSRLNAQAKGLAAARG